MSRIPLAIPNIGAAEGANLQKCVDDNFVSSVGPFVDEFENHLAELSGVKKAVAMGAGTQALHMALHCLGVGPGDLVISPSFTFIASANAIAHCGARPWLFDISKTSWLLDPDEVAAGLARDAERRADGVYHKPSGARIAALMPVYTLGVAADLERFADIAKEYGLPIVADAAAAIGVSYAGRKIGAFADLTCYSFNGNKTITCGGGGAVVGDDEALLARVKHVSTTARVSRDYDHDEVGYNYRMTNLQAAVGCAQIDRLEGFLEKKASIRRAYDNAFGDVKGVSLFPDVGADQSTYWFSGFVIDEDAPLDAPGICAALGEAGIEARPFWKPVHQQTPYLDAPRADMPVTEGLWERIVTLPCSTSLTDEEQARVIDATLGILRGKDA